MGGAGERLVGARASVFNVVNSILGGGIIGVPGALAKSGFGLGLLLLVVFATALCYTMQLLIHVMQHLYEEGRIDTFAFEEGARATFGPAGRFTILVLQFAYSFGAMVGYMKIIFDVVPDALATLVAPALATDTGRKITTAAIATIFILPLCLLRSVAALSRFSFLSVMMVFGLLVIAAYELAFHQAALCADCTIAMDVFSKPSAVDVLGVFVFSFVAHPQAPLVYRCFNGASDKFDRVLAISVGMAFLATAGMGSVVYATFGDGTQSNMFQSYGAGDIVVQIGRLLLGVMMVLTFPMVLFVAREISQVLYWSCVGTEENSGDSSPEHDGPLRLQGQRTAPLLPKKAETSAVVTERKLPSLAEVHLKAGTEPVLRRRITPRLAISRSGLYVDVLPDQEQPRASRALHVATTVPLWAGTLLLALFVPTLGQVLNLVGGLAGTGIAFTMPCAMALRLETPVTSRNLCWIVLVTGTCAGLATTVVTIAGMIH